MRSLLNVFAALAVVAGARPPVQLAASPVAQDTLPETAFWRQLCDSTLDRLMEEALRANQDLRAAEARVRGARAARSGAALDFVPTVTAGGGFVRQRLSPALFPQGNASGSLPDQSIWDAGFDASWELDVFGRIRHSVKAAGELTNAAREDVRGVQVSLLAELARAYFDYRGGQEQLGVAQRNAENQRRTLELTRQRLEAGRGTAFDTERAQTQLSFTLASIPALQSAVAASQYRIAVLLGRAPGAAGSPVVDSTGAEGLPVLPVLTAAPSQEQVIAQRPDVAAATRRAAAQQALVGAAKADYLPRFSVGGSAGFSSSTFESFGGSGTFRYVVGPGISWPLFNLGRVKAAVNASQARAEEAASQLAQARLLAREDLENALLRYRSALERVRRVEEAAAASRHAAELALLRFTDGVADFLQVLDAERTQLDAESQLAQSRTAAAAAYAALYKALGGVWSPNPAR